MVTIIIQQSCGYNISIYLIFQDTVSPEMKNYFYITAPRNDSSRIRSFTSYGCGSTKSQFLLF